VSNTLRQAREDAGMSQSELARAVEVPQATISAIETGKTIRPGYGLVVRICRAIGREPEDVFPTAMEESA
jgi:DNA-binding XRE family transcriptional regulator